MLRACVCLVLLVVGPAIGGAAQAPPRIATPDVLAVEMAKALVAGDRARFTALAATREEMEAMLEAAQPPSRPEERREMKEKVAEILADRRGDFDRFQAMKKAAGVTPGAAVRFEVIELDRIFEKDGMTKIRHSRVRMFQTPAGGNEQPFLIALDDMFLFERGWAFTSVSPAIGKEPPAAK
jgi:hypothetical protein